MGGVAVFLLAEQEPALIGRLTNDAGHRVHTARPAEFLAALWSFGMDRDIGELLFGGVSPG